MHRDVEPEPVWLMTMPGPAPASVELVDEFRKVTHIRDHVTAADHVFDTLKADGRLDLLRPLLAHALANFRRGEVRALEHALMDDGATITTGSVDEDEPATTKPKRRRTARTATTSVPSLADLLADDFFTGARWVTYSEATVDDYEQSISYLRRKIDGLGLTITFRTRCIAAITAHPGAATLSDVPEAVVRDVLRGT